MPSTLVDQVKGKIAQIQKLRQAFDQKQGERSQLMKQLKQEFDVDTVEAGETLLDEYSAQAQTHETELKDVEGKLDDILAASKTEES